MTSLAASPLTWIIFGAAAQLSLMAYLRHPDRRAALLPPAVIAACLVAAIPTAADGAESAYQIGMGFGLFIASLMVASAAPAALNEGIALAVTATFWTSLYASSPADWYAPFLLVSAVMLAAPFTLLLAGLAATATRPPEWLRFVLYLWTVFAMIVVGVARFPFRDFAALDAAGLGWVSILTATYLGAHLALLVHNVLSILLLVPIPAEDQTFSSRLKQVERYAESLIARYSPEPAGRARALAIVAGQAALSWGFMRWRPEGSWLAAHATVSICLVAATFFTRAPRPHPRPLPTGGDIAREKRRRPRPGRDGGA